MSPYPTDRAGGWPTSAAGRRAERARIQDMVDLAKERRAWAQEAAARRAQQRSNTARVPLTLDALIDRMGWDRAYAEHLVQPYCECGDTADGWDYCQHVYDEELR